MVHGAFQGVLGGPDRAAPRRVPRPHHQPELRELSPRQAHHAARVHDVDQEWGLLAQSDEPAHRPLPHYPLAAQVRRQDQAGDPGVVQLDQQRAGLHGVRIEVRESLGPHLLVGVNREVDPCDRSEPLVQDAARHLDGQGLA